MRPLSTLLVSTLFYVPVAATFVNPFLGLGVTTLFVIWHYRHQPFKRALDQMDATWELKPLDPMEVISD